MTSICLPFVDQDCVQMIGNLQVHTEVAFRERICLTSAQNLQPPSQPQPGTRLLLRTVNFYYVQTDFQGKKQQEFHKESSLCFIIILGSSKTQSSGQLKLTATTKTTTISSISLVFSSGSCISYLLEERVTVHLFNGQVDSGNRLLQVCQEHHK